MKNNKGISMSEITPHAKEIMDILDSLLTLTHKHSINPMELAPFLLTASSKLIKMTLKNASENIDKEGVDPPADILSGLLLMAEYIKKADEMTRFCASAAYLMNKEE